MADKVERYVHSGRKLRPGEVVYLPPSEERYLHCLGIVQQMSTRVMVVEVENGRGYKDVALVSADPESEFRPKLSEDQEDYGYKVKASMVCHSEEYYLTQREAVLGPAMRYRDKLLEKLNGVVEVIQHFSDGDVSDE